MPQPARRALPSLGRVAALALACACGPLVPAAALAAVQAPADLEAFLDGLVEAQSRELHVPGTVFVWVEDGAVRLAKGWGRADLQSDVPVDPDRTLFRVASISKLFTATAAMQLRERGLIDFDTDVNEYLERFQVPEAPSGPVTMARLLTHTAGFDDRNIGMGTWDPADALPLGKYLANHLPPRVLPAGDVISYSNHGLALAGYLVQVRSGRPFADYVRANIFAPLGIRRAGWGEAEGDEAIQATGYEWRDGGYRVRPGDAFNEIVPAAGLTITASDMARFMIAQLQGGRLGDARILSEQSVHDMQTRHAVLHPDLAGWGYGFEVGAHAGHRVVSHGGWTDGFCSLLVLLPDDGAGFFVSVTTNCRFGLLDTFEEAVLDRVLPASEEDVAPPPASNASPDDAQAEAASVEGSYWPSRHSRTTVERTSMLWNEVRAVPGRRGSILRLLRPGADPLRLRRVGPLRYDEIGGGHRVAFRERDGRVTDLFLDATAFERVPWWDTQHVTEWVLGGSVAVVLTALALWPWQWLRRRLSRAPGSPADPRLRGARLVAGLSAAAYVGWLLGAGLLLAGTSPFDLVRGPTPGLRRLLALPILGALLSGPTVLFAGLALWRGLWSRGARWHYAAVAAATGLLTLVAVHWCWLTPGV